MGRITTSQGDFMKAYDVEQYKKMCEDRKKLPRTVRETPFGSPVSKEMEQQVLALKNTPLPVTK
jgi:hypothetical protein